MSVLDRSALSDSPLADLHAIASELALDGYRRLRRDDLIEAILDKQGGAAAAGDDDGEAKPKPRRRSRTRSTSTETEATPVAAGDDDGEEEPAPKPRRSRSRRSATARDEEETTTAKPEAEVTESEEDEAPARSARGRSSRGRGGRSGAAAEPETTRDAPVEDELVTGTVEVLPGGSGFLRVAGPEPSDDDVYISSAQVKRCELVTGDTVAGPKRAPRRSERFASLIRIETINGRPASELADSVRFDDLPATLPSTRLVLGGEDPTLKAIDALVPFGQGSRVTITGPSRAGKTEALRLIASALSAQEGITVSIALAGVRPEELSEWSAEDASTPAPAATLSFAASEDARVGAIEPVVDQARRLAARGSHAVVLIDTLDGLDGHAARRIMASARCLTGGGSVTIIATASAPLGGETTVIALDLARTSTARFPAIDLLASGTLRPETLLGVTAVRKIVRERAKAAKD